MNTTRQHVDVTMVTIVLAPKNIYNSKSHH